MTDLTDSFSRGEINILTSSYKDTLHDIAEEDGMAIGHLVSQGLVIQRGDKYQITTKGIEVGSKLFEDQQERER